MLEFIQERSALPIIHYKLSLLILQDNIKELRYLEALPSLSMSEE